MAIDFLVRLNRAIPKFVPYEEFGLQAILGGFCQGRERPMLELEFRKAQMGAVIEALEAALGEAGGGKYSYYRAPRP